MRKISRRKELEMHKAAKHQPELVLAHLRNFYHAEALAQIQCSMSREDTSIPGFDRFKNIVQHENDLADSATTESLLEERVGVLYVNVFNEQLEHVHTD